MNRKKIVFVLLFIIFSFIMFGFVRNYQSDSAKINISFQVKSDVADDYQLFYLTNSEEKWSEEKSVHIPYVKTLEWVNMEVELPKNATNVRLDFGTKATTLNMKNLVVSGNINVKMDLQNLAYDENQLETSSKNETSLSLITQGGDPYIAFSIKSVIDESLQGTSLIKNIINIFVSCLVGLLISFVCLTIKDVLHFIKMNYLGRSMVMNLARNDFKTKYASSYLGVTWGFIQPLMTIATYWFVFQVGLRSGNVSEMPFILWFLVAIVPWFFFSEAFSSATNVFSEYSYLVKKVVFKIELLPMVKITSAFFVHIFFLIFIFIIYSVYGYFPSIFNLQIIYYVFCSIVLVISISIFSSALVLFFKDLNQIIMIVLQMGFWFTPIGWSYTMLPSAWLFIFKLNPMFYIVEGFRDSFISHIAFYNHPYQTFYFWLFCFAALGAGIKTFGKLKPHFADVI
ncbi:ABC transporter permease [Paenibacillus sp. FSL R7-0179]|uniref:ABC transporter permease n=1 Tax=Paenibacillus sp. FSL R7-0179 TaxID=2921672 RepID=UPI0030F714DF